MYENGKGRMAFTSSLSRRTFALMVPTVEALLDSSTTAAGRQKLIFQAQEESVQK